ncbi:glycosyltransferase involved in cell wall biosynthesis [Labrenzia sp. EL_208]|nr:glycosyltransferase involved in cell wall biosynthesis [Labrenzia sp. EL_132]MBG6229537.1 glycosyltransferase involved in cell wall biosynthesis [Labrenzia sp. EL_208]
MISVCIPTYEMGGSGAKFLKQSFDRLKRQTSSNFEVVVSDQSENSAIADLCESYKTIFSVTYTNSKHLKRSSSVNLNNAMRHATGGIIKVLFQDDLIINDDALDLIRSAFENGDQGWLLSGCMHTTDGNELFRRFEPKYHPAIYLGRNTISSPSVLAFRREDHLWFDENLIWLMDVDFYKSCHDALGAPIILTDPLIANRIHPSQVSQNMRTDIMLRELRHVRKKNTKTETFDLRVKYYKEFFRLQKRELEKNRLWTDWKL